MRTWRNLIALSGCFTLAWLACGPGRVPSELGGKSRVDEAAALPIQAVGPVDRDVVYTLFDESVSDAPIKTQIEQHIVAQGIPSREGLVNEIHRRYAEAKARRGFRYHNPASNIYIYVYGSEEQARARQGLWIGMVAKGPAEKGEPQVQIGETRLAALSAQPEERFGLSAEERQRVFREIAAAEKRATQEAMERVPDSRIMEQIELERDLAAEYKRALARKYTISEEELQGIGLEGVKKGWPWS
jgi:hypothetical protein